MKVREFCSKVKGVAFRYLLSFRKVDNETDSKYVNNNLKSYSYLQNKYKHFLDEMPIYEEGKDREDIIWWCWFQGEENAPKLNKSCLESLRKYVKNKKIIVIDEDNINEYVKFPKHILKKYKSGIITKTHLSDLLRCELLIKYGGTWIDSSVLLTGYNKEFFDSDFFVFNNYENNDESIMASSWFITSNKNNPILLTTRNLLYEYWKHENFFVNYFIFHMFFTMATKKYKKLWNSVPKYSNNPPHVMQKEYLKKYDKKRFEELKEISTIHKLSQKVKSKDISNDSLYNYIENLYDCDYMTDKISIVVPIYNVEQYLNKCLDSIIKQTYKNLEIILVDDGSTDNSLKICKKYEKDDKRIKVIHQENAGLSCARNTGIKNSTGKYIMFIDSDDYIENNMVDYLYKDLIKNNADISICSYNNVYLNKIRSQRFKKNIFIVDNNNKYKYLYNKYHVVSVVAWNKIYKKSLFDDTKYMNGKYHEDEIIILELFKKAKRISYNLVPLYNYVKRSNSITNKFNRKMFDLLISYENRKEYFTKIKNDELIDLNEYFLFHIYYKILISYDKTGKNELSKKEVSNIYDKCNSLCKKLIKSKHLSIVRKITMLIYLISKKIFYSIMSKF